LGTVDGALKSNTTVLSTCGGEADFGADGNTFGVGRTGFSSAFSTSGGGVNVNTRGWLPGDGSGMPAGD
jgi:hypothetical protein